VLLLSDAKKWLTVLRELEIMPLLLDTARATAPPKQWPSPSSPAPRHGASHCNAEPRPRLPPSGRTSARAMHFLLSPLFVALASLVGALLA
jgi:hypothetical protein